MKYLSLIIAVLFIGLGYGNIQAQSSDRDEFEVRVDGLGCPFCAYGLEKKMKKLKGVKKLTIDMEVGLLEFTYPSEKALQMDAVEAQVTDAGYTPISVKITRADGTVEETEEIVKDFTNVKLTEDEFFVAGKCGMCEKRIEAAVKKMEGVSEAEWDVDTKTISVSYDAEKHSERDIHKAIAKVGHDTELYRAKDDTYKNLPGCCKYKREKQ